MPRSPRHWLSQSRHTGTPPDGGFHKLCAYIGTKVRGTRTPATDIGAASNFWTVRGAASGGTVTQTWLHRASSFTAPGSSIAATVTRGANGAPQELVDSGEAWVRANREALGYDR